MRIIKWLMEELGYYKKEDLQHWGHCGICGRSMEGIFEKIWAIGVCEHCIARYGEGDGED